MNNNTSRPLPIIAIILLFLILCGGGYLVLKGWQSFLQTRKLNLEKAIASLTNEFPLAQIAIQQTQPEIAGQVVFFGPNGTPIKGEAFEMTGEDLYIEFLVISWQYLTNRFVFAYPQRIYSEKVAPEDGIDILSSYTNNLSLTNEAEKLAILLLNQTPPSGVSLNQKTTVAVHQYPGRSWQNTSYEVIYRQNGTLELREKP